MSKLRFDDRVAIVTGAGGGLGRSHALLLGSLGAKVVVNDLGGGATGGGKSSSAADKVVEEIKAMGGEAVANYDSVEHGDKIVQTALDAFGTVDIVINNAGILRDVSFHKMTQDDWDLILKVHLTGSMSVSHAAWPIMREKNYGRIIMTTSAAGIYGNFGQANYCAAKLGITGLANCLAEEGRSKNIFVNTIAPIAASRLTETVMPPELLKNLNPEAVSPLVAWLSHEDCQETKGLFEVGAGYIAKLRWERSKGNSFALGKQFSVDDVAARWSKVTDFTDAEHPSSVNESFMPILNNINNPSLGGNEFIDLDEASKAKVEMESEYNENDLALYALGVGAARDPLDKSELKYVYELGSDFQALPTFGVMPQSSAMLKMAKEGKFALPGMNFGLDRLLHGEQYTEIKRPLPRKAKLKHIFRFKEAFDKDPNAVVTFAISTLDEKGNELIYNEMTSFVKGAGGWGGDRGPSADINVPPEREPDAVIEEQTDPNQTLLYRLSGDWNPLHADPAFAQAFGYDKPILHGLCTFGYVGRHVVKAFCDNDGRLFKSIKVRFAKNVFPGETLVTKMWKESDNRIILETRVKERDEVVIKNAAVELYTEIPKEAPAPKAADAGQTAAAVEESVTLEDVFTGVANYIAANSDLVDKTKTAFQFHFTNPDKDFFIDLKNAPGSAGSGAVEGADVTLELDTKHVETLFGGDLAEVQKLYFGGELKVTGNVMASNKLSVLQGMDPQLVEDARAQRVAAGGGSAAPAAASGQPELVDVFAAVNAYIGQNPDFVEKTKTAFQFEISNPDQTFFIDLKNESGSAGEGAIDNPDVTLAMDSKHLETVFGGDLAAVQQLYFGGDLKISGNIMASNKLMVLQGMDPKMVEEAYAARAGAGGGAAGAPAAASQEPTLDDVFSGINTFIGQNADLVDKTKTCFQFVFHNPEQSFFIDLKKAPGSAGPGMADSPDVTLELDTEHVQTLFGGDLAAVQQLYFGGQLKISGNVMASNKLSVLQGMDPKLVEQARDKRLASGAPKAAPAAASKKAPKKPRAADALAALEQKLATAKGLKGAVQFRVTDPDGDWVIDFSANPPVITSGAKEDTGAVVTVADGKLADWIDGKSKLRELYQKGDLRVDGDVTLVSQLESIL